MAVVTSVGNKLMIGGNNFRACLFEASGAGTTVAGTMIVEKTDVPGTFIKATTGTQIDGCLAYDVVATGAGTFAGTRCFTGRVDAGMIATAHSIASVDICPAAGKPSWRMQLENKGLTPIDVDRIDNIEFRASIHKVIVQGFEVFGHLRISTDLDERHR